MLFRDIQPEAFYPMYGDSSLKQFDAQTSGRFYARVDRGLGYVMYGDLQTSSFSPRAQAARRVQPRADRRPAALRELADDGQRVRQP